MKAKLLVANHAYLFFGTTLYVGVLWALRFFWYPSWEIMTLEAVGNHFILPTTAATKFFTVVVPLMFLANIVLIVSERHTKKPLVASILAFVCIATATLVGTLLIIPTNKQIAAGAGSAARLNELLERWMMLNDVRFVLLTLMWLAMLYYFVEKGRLLATLGSSGR